MPVSTWTEFWRKEENAFFEIMRMSTSVFGRRLINHFQIGEKHRVLDFGCGPGFLVETLVKQGSVVSGVDINVKFIEKCKEVYPNCAFKDISEAPSEIENTLSQSFQNEKFDYIIMLSVAQYFETQETFQRVIAILSRFLSSSGSIIIADVMTPKTSSIADLLAVLKFSLLSGKFLSLVRFISYLLLSDYRKLSSAVKLQSYSDNDMKRIASFSNHRCNRIDGLTLHPTRTNYVLFS